MSPKRGKVNTVSNPQITAESALKTDGTRGVPSCCEKNEDNAGIML